MNRRMMLGTAAVVLLFPFSLLGNEKEKPKSADDLDKKVLEIVKKTGDLYKNAKSFHTDGSIVTKVEADGKPQEVKVSAVYDVAKPSQFAVRTKVDGDDAKGPDLVADGKKVFVHRKALKQYTESDPPGSLGDVGLSLLRLDPTFVGMLFANIVGDDPADLLMQGVTSCSYAGLDKVDGTPAHHMKFSQPEFDWELWVASEGKPYILRFSSARKGPNGTATTTETYKNWKLDEAAEKDTFKFEAPKDAKKVDEPGQPSV
jgi:hypothetical protein